ncbi:MAG TPA: hypothetical protein VMV32_06635 [Ignavibacteriaceae bacterium]|nr:hypothetical protein [Ignavibacteriaceae bacterium]
MAGRPAGAIERVDIIPHGLWHPSKDKRLIHYKPGTRRLIPQQKWHIIQSRGIGYNKWQKWEQI